MTDEIDNEIDKRQTTPYLAQHVVLTPGEIEAMHRGQRLADIQEELKPLRDAMNALIAEKCALEREQARADWPDGPFTLHYWRHFQEMEDEYDTPQAAVRAADGMEDMGTASTRDITDRHGRTIYSKEPMSCRLAPVVDGYPEVLEP